VLDAGLSKLIGGGANVTTVRSPLHFAKLLPSYLRLSMFEFTPKENNAALHYLFWAFESARSLFRGGTANTYRKLKQEQSYLSSRLEEFLGRCDCWVLPVTPSVAFPHQRPGRPIKLKVAGRARRYGYWAASMGLTYPFNLLGNPSVVIPVGRSADGMPVAIQAVGRRGEDRRLLQVASYLAARIGSDARPGDSSKMRTVVERAPEKSEVCKVAP
jgi:amidase